VREALGPAAAPGTTAAEARVAGWRGGARDRERETEFWCGVGKAAGVREI
jgi:hypothetical protein